MYMTKDISDKSIRDKLVVMTSICIFWQIAVTSTINSPREGDSLRHEAETRANGLPPSLLGVLYSWVQNAMGTIEPLFQIHNF